MTAFYALVGPQKRGQPQTIHHTLGYPELHPPGDAAPAVPSSFPDDLRAALSADQPGLGFGSLPWPAVVILEVSPSDAMVYRYAADGAFAGDTWHETEAAAREQAAFEYGQLLSEWTLIPDDHDPTDYALAHADAPPDPG